MIIGKLEKNAFDSIVVQTTEFKGRELIDIRIFYLDSGGELKPTKKGISISPDHVPELIKLIQKAYEEIGQEEVSV